ncbi:MAG: hypothetical protein U9M95_03910 [Candidatus Altiarchaeota archaeon]|nr:hypothetical protein [Candidatus Altiarchaeota archaeon]
MGTPIQYLSDEAKFEYYFGGLGGSLEKRVVSGLTYISGYSRAGDKLGGRLFVQKQDSIYDFSIHN